MKGILRKRRTARLVWPVHNRPVGFVIGEQRPRPGGRRGDEPPLPQPVDRGNVGIGRQVTVVGQQAERAAGSLLTTDHRLRLPCAVPTPRVAKPERRQHVQRGRVGPVVRRRDPDGDLLGIRLRILDQDVEITVLGEDAGVDEFVLRVLRPPALAFLDQLRVGKRPLRVAVEQCHIRMGGGIVDMEEILLHVFPVIALVWGQSEQSFLEVRITTVPEGRSEAEPLIAVAETGDAVLAPPVGFCPGLVIREISPCVPVGGIVLADGAPGPVRQVGPPAAPTARIVRNLMNPLRFGV